MPTTAAAPSLNGLRHRESHAEAIYSLSFNQVDASLASTFATVGANRVTVYSIQSEGEEKSTTPQKQQPPQKPKQKGKGKKRGSEENALPVACTVVTLQAYCDEDEDECFYCCAWGLQEKFGSSSSSCSSSTEATSSSSPGASSAEEEAEPDSSTSPAPATGGTHALGSLLAVGGAMRHIKLLDCCAGKFIAVLQGHGGAINELRFHPRRPSLLLSASADESCRLWHVGSRECLATFAGDGGHRDAVISLDIHLDGNSFATGSIDGTVKVWPLSQPSMSARIDAADERASSSQQEPGEEEEEGKSGSDAASRSRPVPPAVVQTPLATYDRVHHDVNSQLSYWIDCGALAPIASLKVGDAAKKAKAQSKSAAAAAAQEQQLTIRFTALSHDGRLVVSGCDDGSIVAWDLGSASS